MSRIELDDLQERGRWISDELEILFLHSRKMPAVIMVGSTRQRYERGKCGSRFVATRTVNVLSRVKGGNVREQVGTGGRGMIAMLAADTPAGISTARFDGLQQIRGIGCSR